MLRRQRCGPDVAETLCVGADHQDLAVDPGVPALAHRGQQVSVRNTGMAARPSTPVNLKCCPCWYGGAKVSDDPQRQGRHAPTVDVEAVLSAMAQDAGQTLDWRHSIVDLMKLLSIDSSLANRKELAGELGYTGDTGDSATMNIWLHKAVMTKLADNGGIVPQSLR